VTAIFAVFTAAITFDLAVVTCRPGTDRCNRLSLLPEWSAGLWLVIGAALPIVLTIGVAGIIGRERRLRRQASSARDKLPEPLQQHWQTTTSADPVTAHDLTSPELWKPHGIALSLGLVNSGFAIVAMAWVLLIAVGDLVSTGWRSAGTVACALATLAVLAATAAASAPLHGGVVYRRIATGALAATLAAFVTAALAAGTIPADALGDVASADALNTTSIGVAVVLAVAATFVGVAGLASRRSTAGAGSMLALAGLVGAAFGAGVYTIARTMLTSDTAAADAPALVGVDWTALAFLVVLLVIVAAIVTGMAIGWSTSLPRSVAVLVALRRVTGLLRRYFSVITTSAIATVGVFLVWLVASDSPGDSPFGSGFPADWIVGTLGAAVALAATWFAWRYTGEVGATIAVAAAAAIGGWLLASGHVPEVKLFGVTLRFGDLREIATSVAVLVPTGFIITRLVGTLRDREARRGIAMVWDLGSFWPRWYHPFAAPYYTPIVVPDLQALIAEQIATPGCGVIVAAHSQGTVIAMAALLAVPEPDRPAPSTVALLTYGSPISHLYERLFPAYFSREAIARLHQRFGGEHASRWNNLWRDTDPIGAAVSRPGVDHDLSGDRELTADPARQGPIGFGHSNYEKTEGYAAARSRMASALRTAPPPADAAPEAAL